MSELLERLRRHPWLTGGSALAILASITYFAWPDPELVTYKVKEHDIVDAVATANCHTREQVRELNEEHLEAKAKKRCADPASANGYFCHRGLTDADGNSLLGINSILPGDGLLLYKDIVEKCPSATAKGAIASR